MNYVYIETHANEPPITPAHINTNEHFWSAFGHMETEFSARWLVRFCQERNEGWQPIPVQKLTDFYCEKLKKQGAIFYFNKLTDGWVKVENEMVILSKQFIARCWSSSPA